MFFTVDFDGTVCDHRFPDIGHDVPNAVFVLQDMVRRGHKIILNTMRSDIDEGKTLSAAVKWFEERGIPLFAVNENPTQKNWSLSPKPYAHGDIDDNNVGCPKIFLAWMARPCVDWLAIHESLKALPEY